MSPEELDAAFTAVIREHCGIADDDDIPALLGGLREVAEQHATDIHNEARA